MLYRNRYRIARGALWALLLLAALVLQGTVCNRLPLLGVSPLLLPVAAVCVAMMGSAEFGAAIGLAGGLLGYLGGGAAALFIPLLCLAGALAGGLCSQYFTRSLLPALLLALMALLLCALAVLALRCYLGHAPVSALLRVVLPETVYSLLYTPLLYLLSWRISLIRRS